MRQKLLGLPIFTLTLALLSCLGLDGDDAAETTGETGASTGESAVSASSASSAGNTDSTGDLSADLDEPLKAFDCELNDKWEPNFKAKKATMVSWQAVSAWSAYTNPVVAHLCAGESDWYRFGVESLGYETHNMYLRVMIKDAGSCGLSCEEPVIPTGPEHAMTVEIFRADTLELVGTQTESGGVLKINGSGDNFSHDLLIHVFSPTPDAAYPYHFSFEIRSYDGEDECEC